MIHLDESRRAEAIDAGWIAHMDQLPGGEQFYRDGCKDWLVIAVCDDDKVIGALYARDGVIHLGIVPEYRKQWASKRVIRSMLAYGNRTNVRDGSPERIEFANRLGFVRQGDTYEFHR